MNFIRLLAAIMFFISEVFSRKFHRKKSKIVFCQHGDRNKGETCK